VRQGGGRERREEVLKRDAGSIGYNALALTNDMMVDRVVESTVV
jgi:hypothetical protein